MNIGSLKNYARRRGRKVAASSCGKEKAFPLSLARRGENLRIAAFLTGKGLGKRLGDLGLHKGSAIQVVHRERSGATIVVFQNNRIAVGASVAQMISVTLCNRQETSDDGPAGAR